MADNPTDPNKICFWLPPELAVSRFGLRAPQRDPRWLSTSGSQHPQLFLLSLHKTAIELQQKSSKT
eukprot:scaffold28376_cov15-Tisochrysis_lutea.AAC.1